MKRFAILFLTALLILSAGCDPVKRDQRELVRLQQSKAEMLGSLYNEYGGSPLSDTLKKEFRNAKKIAPPEAAESASQVVENIDASVFENYILSLGGGGRPFVFTQKARDFFAREDVRKKAVKIYEMDLRIRYLQEKLESSARSGV